MFTIKFKIAYGAHPLANQNLNLTIILKKRKDLSIFIFCLRPALIAKFLVLRRILVAEAVRSVTFNVVIFAVFIDDDNRATVN